jgi:hypothetical protein
MFFYQHLFAKSWIGNIFQFSTRLVYTFKYVIILAHIGIVFHVILSIMVFKLINTSITQKFTSALEKFQPNNNFYLLPGIASPGGMYISRKCLSIKIIPDSYSIWVLSMQAAVVFLLCAPQRHRLSSLVLTGVYLFFNGFKSKSFFGQFHTGSNPVLKGY